MRDTKEIVSTLRTPRGRANHAVPVCAPLNLPALDLPIQPYTLGAWLGDGTSLTGQVCGIDAEVFQEIESEGYTVSGGYYQKKLAVRTVRGLVTALRSNHLLGNKHIPSKYLRASYSQRLSLLQGLMDTDGHADKKSGYCEFCTIDQQFGKQVYELVVSLGIKASIRESDAKIYGRITSKRYRVCFTTSQPVFRLKRKLDRLPKKIRRTTQFRYIVGAKRLGVEHMQCLQVDSPRRATSVVSLFLSI